MSEGKKSGLAGVTGPELVAWAALAALAAFFVAATWRRWPDPMVDFGRELYTPWRLAHGALLYRDADDIYGPLSQYFNAGLFALFGPGLMVLVAANLAVFAGIAASIYALFRRAWGPGAAFFSTALFISVFGFSQFLGIGNYNYATPYSHEATHGLLVCLVLALVLARWTKRPTAARSAAAGLLLGLTTVLKPEAMLAGAAVTLAALVFAVRRGSVPRASAVAAWAGSAVLPTAAFTAFFAARVPLKSAVSYACRAWLYAASSAGFSGLPLQKVFLGTDRPWHNAAVQLGAAGLALALFAGICGLAWLAGRARQPWLRIALAALLAAGVLWLSWFRIDWFSTGRCLPFLTLIYIVYAFIITGWSGSSRDAFRPERLLAGVLAGALMARMFLNGRIYHYGFFEAALAAILVPAVAIGELPSLLRAGPRARHLIAAGTILLIAPGAFRLARDSLDRLWTKTYAVGTGADRFYAFPPQILATGDMVRVMSGWLAEKPRGQTAVVLPEGEMINYLARMPSPIPPYAYFGAATRDGREETIVAELERHPPDWIVIVSRDMSDSGVSVYGEISGEGRDILAWAADHYRPAMSVGGNPLDPGTAGAVVLQRIH